MLKHQEKTSLTDQLLLLAAVTITSIGQTVVFAILPSLSRETGLADVHMGIIISCSSLVFALASPLWGRYSERVGRKPVLMFGLIGYTVGTFLFAGAFWFGLKGYLAGGALLSALIVTRILQSTVMAATPPAAAAYMADISSITTRTKAMAKIATANSLGNILGPAAGGAIAVALSLVAPLFIIVVLVAIMAIVIGVKFNESPYILSRDPITTKTPMLAAIAATYKAYLDPRLTGILMLGVGMFFSFAVVQQTLGFLFQDKLLLPPKQAAASVGIAMMIAATASIISQIVIVQKLSWSTDRLLKIGFTSIALGVACLLLAQQHLSIIVAVTLVGLGVGLAMPGISSAASLRVGANEQGAVAGMLSAAPALGFTVGPVMGTGLYQLNPQLPYILVLIIFVPLLCAVWRITAQTAQNEG
ncbi:MAG TPA: MFS transporter [Alcanivoracaceae bacterium]|nr:MFS transporter [Alcanivoracaceae bacterium]